ncbi:hypothetical protein GYMLUDRAFT_59402 [Collybiopsis luxurians FD-317 M1]|uniref:Uncharacterized protein n=1 Tax=Collybiopsis luxurians FD-317 M1 TaxID=944289 RepID=A0A0D0CPA9_9AGAR|nr:hypothetical protein GYMLUDRAFT_59402 [Collybiopsis luxurians FD-317 M1]
MLKIRSIYQVEEMHPFHPLMRIIIDHVSGWIKLEGKDIVFVQDIDGKENDTFEVYVGEQYVIAYYDLYYMTASSSDENSKMGKIIQGLRDESLGSCQFQEENQKTQFQSCEKLAKPVGSEGSCYSCSLSHQKPRNVVTPSAGGKAWGGMSEQETEHINARNRLVAEYEALETAAELHNVPQIGTDNNICFQGVQLNLSQPVFDNDTSMFLFLETYKHFSQISFGTVTNCIKALAFFGGKHLDSHDSPGGYTTLFSYPDIPAGWEGGCFHIVDFGLYVKLDGLKSITFSGLHLHGGTSLLAPAVVLYPQGATLDGQVIFNIGADSDGAAIQLTSQMKDPIVNLEKEGGSKEEFRSDECGQVTSLDGISFSFLNRDIRSYTEEPSTSSKELNFIDDGYILMTPQAEWQLCGGVSGNFDTYWQLWSIKCNGVTYSPKPWKLAPDGSTKVSLFIECLHIAHQKWTEHCNRRLQIIPSASCSLKLPSKTISPPQFIGTFSKPKQAAKVTTKKAQIAQTRAKRKKVKLSAAVEILNVKKLYTMAKNWISVC